MIVPTESPKIVITNRKLYYAGTYLFWIGVIPTLGSIYAHINLIQDGNFTPEILLNKALLIGGVVVSILGLVMVNKNRKVTGKFHQDPPFIMRSHSEDSIKK